MTKVLVEYPAFLSSILSIDGFSIRFHTLMTFFKLHHQQKDDDLLLFQPPSTSSTADRVV